MPTKLMIFTGARKGTEDTHVMALLPEGATITEDDRAWLEGALDKLAATFDKRRRAAVEPPKRTPTPVVEPTKLGRIRAIVKAGAGPRNPPCPRCGGQMALRTRRDDNTKFWGCLKYPECRGTVNSMVEQAAANAKPHVRIGGIGGDDQIPF